MDNLRVTSKPDPLRQPTLIAAFEGWNDAGEAATGALEAIAASASAERFADIDPEEFYDFQVARPVIRWRADQRIVDWPSNAFSFARLDGPRDAVFLRGHEPNTRWRTFTETILGLASEVGATRIITLGALQVDRPHTRTVSMTGSASDSELAAQQGLRKSTYEGPTGIVGVLHQAAADAGLEAITLWVGVPHYLSGTTYARASLALAERVVDIMGSDLSLEDLAHDAAQQLEDIQELVDEDAELAEYVVELEQRADAEPDPLDSTQLPNPPVSGEELAREFERYLRDRPQN